MNYLILGLLLVISGQCFGQQQPQQPVILWGKCPELEPSESDKIEKQQIIQQCMQSIPVPPNINDQLQADQYRKQLAYCGLNNENWFDEKGNYKFDRALEEIKKKQLKDKAIETQIIEFHTKCKTEAINKYNNSQSSRQSTFDYLDLISLYQACMDYHISQVCNIQISAS